MLLWEFLFHSNLISRFKSCYKFSFRILSNPKGQPPQSDRIGLNACGRAKCHFTNFPNTSAFQFRLLILLMNNLLFQFLHESIKSATHRRTWIDCYSEKYEKSLEKSVQTLKVCANNFNNLHWVSLHFRHKLLLAADCLQMRMLQNVILFCISNYNVKTRVKAN